MHTQGPVRAANHGHDDLRSGLGRAALADHSAAPTRATPFFETYAPQVRALYDTPPSDRLSDVNRSLIEGLCRTLGITTPIRWSSEYHPREGRNERLIDLCVKAGATDYLSGPSARGYIDEAAFASAGVTVHFVDYSGIPSTRSPIRRSSMPCRRSTCSSAPARARVTT